MLKLTVMDETRFFDSPEALYRGLGDICGRDVEDTLTELYQNAAGIKCSGECDETYRIEEHYQRMIRDLLEDLTLAIRPGQTTRDKIKTIIEKVRKDL